MDFDVNLGLEACKISYEKSMDFEATNQKIREKINSKNNVVFDCIFLWVLGGPKGRKIEILGFFLCNIMLFKPIILVKIHLDRIDGEKHMDFVLFFVLLFVFF